MKTAIYRLSSIAVIACSLCGCESWHKKKCSTCPPPPPPGAQIITPGAPGGPPQGGIVLPPAPLPGNSNAAPPPQFPAGASYPPIASAYPPNQPIRIGVPDTVSPRIAAPVQPTPTAPAPTPNPTILTPAPIPGSTPSVKLLPPEFGPQNPAKQPDSMTPTPSMPVGIPDFAPALGDKVASGRKPSLEGLDWLKANNFKSAILIRRPDETDDADRRQFEQRALAFQSLEVSPSTLSWATVDQFSKLVDNSTMQPIFVYDADGALAGGMWYLYFRRVEKLPDEAARLRASRLGLRESGDGPHRDMWLAVQKLLSAG